jgi:hypothetical protein
LLSEYIFFLLSRLHYIFHQTRNISKTGNVLITYHWDAFLQALMQWKSSKYYTTWLCVCSLSFPACNARALYCHLWPDPLYNILPHYLTNRKIFDKKILNIKCVFWFCLQLLPETFLILGRTERDMIKNV